MQPAPACQDNLRTLALTLPAFSPQQPVVGVVQSHSLTDHISTASMTLLGHFLSPLPSHTVCITL